MNSPIPQSTRAHTTLNTYEVSALDGQRLQAYAWRPRQQAVRGAVVIVHGLRDHASRYAALAEALTEQGLAVYAQDMRGHGRSSGPRQYFDSTEQLVGDVSLVVGEAQRQNPGVPLFLYGHSLGGMVSTRYALERPGDLRGLVLSGAALKLFPSVSPFQQALARFFGTVAPRLPAQPLDDREFVRDPAAQAELAADPLIDHSNLPARSARAGLDGIQWIGDNMHKLKVPALILHGVADTATNPEGSQELHARAASPDKTLRLLDKMHHDLLHEPEREQIIREVVGWIVARLD